MPAPQVPDGRGDAQREGFGPRSVGAGVVVVRRPSPTGQPLDQFPRGVRGEFDLAAFLTTTKPQGV